MKEQNIFFSDSLKNIKLPGQLRHRLGRRIAFLLQMFKAGQSIHFHEKGQIQRPADPINFLLGNQKLLLDNLKKPLINPFLYLQTDCLPPLAPLELALDFLQQILRLILLNGKIRIAHDTERAGAYNIIIHEQLMNIPLNDFLQQNHRPGLRVLCRDLNYPVKHAGHLDSGKFKALISLLFLHQSPQIQ